MLACSSIKERSKQRDLQSQILRALNAKMDNFANCAHKHHLYDDLGLARVRVEIQLRIDSKGQVDLFQLDNKKYSEKFADCLFNVVDNIVFPALNKDEVIELSQPIIFTKKNSF